MRTTMLIGSHLQVAKSGIHGLGLFTRRQLACGESIFQITGVLKQAPYDARYWIGQRWLSVGPNLWIDPGSGSATRYLNHACEPNVAWRDDGWVAAISAIPEAAELVIDYSTTELDPHWRLDCKCGTSRCRRLVLPGYRESPRIRETLATLTPEFIRKYWPILSPGMLY